MHLLRADKVWKEDDEDEFSASPAFPRIASRETAGDRTWGILLLADPSLSQRRQAAMQCLRRNYSRPCRHSAFGISGDTSRFCGSPSSGRNGSSPKRTDDLDGRALLELLANDLGVEAPRRMLLREQEAGTTFGQESPHEMLRECGNHTETLLVGGRCRWSLGLRNSRAAAAAAATTAKQRPCLPLCRPRRLACQWVSESVHAAPGREGRREYRPARPAR